MVWTLIYLLLFWSLLCEKTWRCTNSMPIQNPFYVYVFVYVQYVCKLEWFTAPGCRISDSGKSSKLDVSSMLLMSIEIAAGLSLGEGKQLSAISVINSKQWFSLIMHTKGLISITSPRQTFYLYGFSTGILQVWWCEEHRKVSVQKYLICSQSTDSKNWWDLISSTLPDPIRFSASAQNLKTVKRFGQIKFQMLSSNEKLVFESGGHSLFEGNNHLTSKAQLCLVSNCTSTPFFYSLCHIYGNISDLRIKSFALSEMGTSGGKISVSRQFMTFL